MNPPERRSSMSLPDGRRLAWSEWGPVAGAPVLFCTGAGMSGFLGFGVDDVPRLGIRLIAVDRPGLGLSDGHASKTLATWVDDIRHLVVLNELHQPAAVGFSQGAPFALALAAAKLVEAVALVAGQDELAHPNILPLLNPDIVNLIRAIQDDPVGTEEYFAQSATAEILWRLIMNMSSERDRAFYTSSDFSEAYQRCLEEGFSQGAQGYARDLINACQRWPFALEGIEARVDIWYGGHDASPVHSPDFGATLASRLRNASRIVDPDHGGSILWTRASDILAKLNDHS